MLLGVIGPAFSGQLLLVLITLRTVGSCGRRTARSTGRYDGDLAQDLVQEACFKLLRDHQARVENGEEPRLNIAFVISVLRIVT